MYWRSVLYYFYTNFLLQCILYSVVMNTSYIYIYVCTGVQYCTTSIWTYVLVYSIVLPKHIFVCWRTVLYTYIYVYVLVYSIVLPVSEELLKTYQGTPSKDWWNNIVLKQSNEEQVQVNQSIINHQLYQSINHFLEYKLPEKIKDCFCF